MTEHRSKWQTEELASIFLEGIREAIPGAALQLEVLGKIVQMWCPQPTRILDLGCGDGVLGRAILDQHPAAYVIFADFSEPMLEAARKRLPDNERISVMNLDFATPAWAGRLADAGLLDVVVSGFAIHHQPDHRKRELYTEIYDLLRDGGVFLNLDHVSSATPSGESIFDSFFVDRLVQFHRNARSDKTKEQIEEVYDQRSDKRENILAPVDSQCQWLRQIGFQDVDCFFKIFELAIFGGRKASGRLDAN